MKRSDRSAARIPVYAMLCTLIVIGRFIVLPFPIPITMQFLFVNTSALILGKKGYIPPLTYLFLGLVGLPIFTTGGGIASLVEPSFGYVIGFVIGAFVTGMLSEKATGTLGLSIASICGLMCVYLCGTGYCLLLGKIYYNEPTPITLLIQLYILPFIIPDTAKCAVSILLYEKLRKHIKTQPTDRA